MAFFHIRQSGQGIRRYLHFLSFFIIFNCINVLSLTLLTKEKYFENLFILALKEFNKNKKIYIIFHNIFLRHIFGAEYKKKKQFVCLGHNLIVDEQKFINIITHRL